MAAPTVSESLPTYWNCAVSIYTEATKEHKNYSNEFRGPLAFFKNVSDYGRFDTQDLVIVLTLALIWTILRFTLSTAVFKPFAQYVKMTPLNVDKFPESAWKCLFYSCTFSYALYLLIISGKYNFFYQPSLIWKDWQVGMVIPLDIAIIYWVQFSFYVHSVYAVLVMDAWRKDSVVMLFHHFLTMALIGFSFATRYHKVGLLVLFVHDVTDICLEFTKCNVYMKNRGGKYYAIHEHISTAGFLSFAITWFVFRLYWYPLKILMSAGWATRAVPRDTPGEIQFYLFFNIMLWILFGLNIYWFGIIVDFFIRIISGRVEEVEDIRETDLDDKKQ